MPKEWEVINEDVSYGVDDFRALTIKERLEIYKRLTKPQRALIDAHRKYLVRSEFIKDSYLSASDWEFLDLKIDDNYPENHKKENMLYCQCGRRLKYQYLVKSKATGKVMGLGIQHFKDHLNIPHQVASEIVQRLNNVDFALDELLWLKRRGIEFPMKLWHSYSLVLFQNQYSKVNKKINHQLGQRFADFKEADMPIYVSDYQAILDEINRIRTIEVIQHKFYNEENFDQFKNSLAGNIQKQSLFDHISIWSSQIQKRLKIHPEKPVLPQSFFKELFTMLQIEDLVDREKEVLTFSNKGMGKWIQKEVYLHLLEKRLEYGLSNLFLNEIHPFMREGLTEFIITFNNKEVVVEVEKEVNDIKEVLSKFDQATRKRILKELEESLL